MILKDGGRLAALGILIGTGLSLVAMRLVGTQIELFQVSSVEPVSLLVVVLVLSSIAIAACWLPARRAAKVDPIAALRTD